MFLSNPGSRPIFLRLATCIGCLIASQSFAQSPYIGQYTGQIKISFSGAITQPPTATGFTVYNVLADGTVAEIGGDPVGSVDAAGTITWVTPNRLNLATGTITAGTLSTTSSSTANGLTTTIQIAAPLVGGAFPADQTFTNQLVDLEPDNGYIDHNIVHFTGSGFIAVGNFGTVALSDDGKTWRRSAAPTARNLNCVTFGNGTYLIGGNNGVLLTSPDGINWVPRNSPFGTSGITGAAYGAGKFLILSATGAHATSTDGISWTTHTVTGGTGTNVRFINGKFVMLPGVRFSDDGITWSALSITTSDIAFGGGQWLCGGANGLAKSVDGINWTGTYAGNVKTVGFGNGRFVARMVGLGGAMIHSADATTWGTANAVYASSNSIAFGNGRFVGVGERLVGSGDGISWEPLRKTSLAPHIVDFIPSSTGNPGLIFNKRRFTDINGVKRVIDVNSWLEDSPSQFYTGPNGMLYLDRTDINRVIDMQTDMDLYGVLTTSSSQNFYVTGEGGVIRRLTIGNQSLPAVTVTPLTSPTTSTLRSCIGNGGSVKLLVGDNGTIVLINNPNGLSPTAVLQTSGTTNHLRFVEFVNTRNSLQLPGLEIAGGNNGTLLVRNATTGAWAKRVTNTTDHLIGITYVSPTNNSNTNGLYVAVGENGAVITSPDSVTWSNAAAIKAPGKLTRFKSHGVSRGVVVGEFGFYAEIFATATGLNSISGQKALSLAFTNGGPRSITQGGGRFVAVGGQDAATSLNGRDWEAAPNFASANAVAYGFGRFVSVGGTDNLNPETNRIHQSTDGLNWSAPAQPAIDRPLYSIIHANGRFIASGARGIVVSSTNGIDWSVIANDLDVAGQTIYSLAHHNGVFVGVGDNSVIASTNGGSTWTSRPEDSATGLKAVAYGNGIFVAVGSDGNTIRSTDGVNFTRTRLAISPSTGERPVFDAMVFANGKFIAFTSKGQAYTTADGVTWVECFTGVIATFTGSTVSNGLAVLIGSGKILGLAVEDLSPYITRNPASASPSQGTTLNLSATASGAGTLEFQWTQDDVPLVNGGRVSGANTANLSITSIQLSDAGDYKLLVSNPGGSRMSSAAAISVMPSTSVGFAAWVETFTFPVNKDGPLDDPDNDGVSNLLEFLFGTHPIQPDVGLLPQIGILTGSQIGGSTVPGKTYFTFQARVRKDRPGVTLMPQAGVSLEDFSPAVATQVGVPVDDPGDPMFEKITYYHTLAIEDNAAKRAFMRLSASTAP